MNIRLQFIAVMLVLALSACGGTPAAPAPAATAAALVPTATNTASPTNTPAAPPTSVPGAAPSATVTSASAQPAATVTVTAQATGKDGLTPIGQIVREFRENKPAATAKYNGKSLMVRGVVNRINEFAGAYNLYLLEPADKEGLVAWLAASVDAKRLAVGQEVTIRCDVKGTESVFQDCVLL